jgi:hypothetical protein
MHLSLALLLGVALPAAPAPSLRNLDFARGRLTHWEGWGFSVGPVSGAGPTLRLGVCSSDNGTAGRTALLHRTVVLPANAAGIRFTAAAVRPAGVAAGDTLDITLEAAGRTFIPKQVLTGAGWRSAPKLFGRRGGKLCEYYWPVASYAGRPVRMAVVDADARPGCYVVCGGFQLVTQDEVNAREFASHMVRLSRLHLLPAMARYDSEHFVAISNAPEDFSEYRLYNCETIYATFFEHFRRRGFAVREPAAKMMVAVFDAQTGFEAYLGRRMSDAVTGIYHTPSNRLIVYDYASNRAFVEGKRQAESRARAVANGLQRERLITDLTRRHHERRTDTNISTIMHEVAHQLSYNGGLLNRGADNPVWLVEGLACYCESTTAGTWQGIGEANPNRVRTLAGPAEGRGSFIPLRELVANDNWLRRARSVQTAVLGYAQSWALFRMLMQEEPGRLRRYMQIVQRRRTPDYRLIDFATAFGSDLGALERRYQAYMRGRVTAGR